MHGRPRRNGNASSAALALPALLLALACAQAESGTFYANRGTRIYADARPPTHWDAASGSNILWKARLPNWSNGSPLLVPAVAGSRTVARLYVLSEPLDYACILSCYDADTGRELWKRDLDPVNAFPDAEQAELRTLAREGWAWNRAMITLWNEVVPWLREQDSAFNPEHAKVSDETKARLFKVFGARFDALGLTFDGIKSGAGGPQTFFPFAARDNAQARRVQRLKERGLAWEHWSYFGTWTGSTFATPASDGKRVFTVTANNLYSCHDPDGNLLWQVLFPWPNGRKASLQIPDAWQERIKNNDGKPCWPFNEQGLFATSPVVAGGRFMSMAGAMVRCFEPATGAVAWAMPMRGGIGQNCATPGVVRLGGETFVIVPPGEGRVGPDGDDIIRVRDGRICGLLPGYTSSKMSMAGPVTEGDVAVGFFGEWRQREVAAHRLTYDAAAETVSATLLWRQPQRDIKLWRACLLDGRLYAGQTVVDVATGNRLAEKLPTARNNYCWWSGMIVGANHLSIDHNGGAFLFRDLATGRKVGEATLPKNPPEAYDAARVRANERGAQWAVLGAATPVADGDRLYVRSFDYLWCIAKRGLP